MVPPNSDRVSRAPPYSGYHYLLHLLPIRGYHPLWLNFPEDFTWWWFLNAVLQPSSGTPPKFGLFPFRSPLLRESLFVFFSSAYLDVSVQRVDFLSDNTPSVYWVVPFGNLRILCLCAAPRSLSQLTTSFIVSQSQGIHHTPLSALKELSTILLVHLQLNILVINNLYFPNMSKSFVFVVTFQWPLNEVDVQVANP